eukprot:COSAG02_NODE_1545_length_11996_cov_6.889636_1_plen_21_part_10
MPSAGVTAPDSVATVQVDYDN